jgi:hypothetical protein
MLTYADVCCCRWVRAQRPAQQLLLLLLLLLLPGTQFTCFPDTKARILTLLLLLLGVTEH